MSQKLRKNVDKPAFQLVMQPRYDQDLRMFDKAKSPVVKKVKRLIKQETNTNDSSTSSKKREKKEVIVQLKSGESIKLCSTCAETHAKTVSAKKAKQKEGSEEEKKKDTKKSAAPPMKNNTTKKKLAKSQVESSPIKNSTPKKKAAAPKIKENYENITIRKTAIEPESKESKNVMTRSRTKKMTEDSKDEIIDEPQELWESILTSSKPQKVTRQKKINFKEIDLLEESENENEERSMKRKKEPSQTRAVSKKNNISRETNNSSDKKMKASTSLVPRNKKTISVTSKGNSKNRTV